ncbi:hypothetical protein ACFE04_022803 [Oxalis oulophora]
MNVENDESVQLLPNVDVRAANVPHVTPPTLNGVDIVAIVLQAKEARKLIGQTQASPSVVGSTTRTRPTMTDQPRTSSGATRQPAPAGRPTGNAKVFAMNE